MNRNIIVLTAVAALLGVTASWLFARNNALHQELLAGKTRCEQRLAQLENDYHAEIDALQREIMAQYNPEAATHGAAVTRQSPAPEKTYQRKYRYLLAEAPLGPVEMDRLRELLLERERIWSAGPLDDLEDPETLQRQNMLNDIDSQADALLSPLDYEKYDLLKESDAEQRYIEDYLRAIGGDAELERTLLMMKLKHKKSFEIALDGSGYRRDRLSAQAREQILETLATALEEYKNDFLKEARPLLNDQQFDALRDHETRESGRILGQIRSQMSSL